MIQRAISVLLAFALAGTLITVAAPYALGQQTESAIAPEPDAVDQPDAIEPTEAEAAREPIEETFDVDPCTCEKQTALAKAAAKAHKGLFYDNNFDYLCDPCYDGCLLGDRLKRNCFGGNGVLDVGGQYRARYHHEHNFRGLGLTGLDDDFLLHRTRLYGNLEIGYRLRAYVEMIDAVSNYETLGPRPIEEDRADLLNGFVDALLLEMNGGDLWARIGRQELFYGSQRLVSPLDWANTRRTFEGYKLMYEGSNWDIDGFWVRPVPPQRTQFDSPDHSQEYLGIYSTYKACENRSLDLYYLRYIETDGVPFVFDTFGARLDGKEGNWRWEFEGDLQFGHLNRFDHMAGAWTVGIGREMPGVAWTPTLWAYYDWASGDETQGNGYHHNFPLAHKYLGFMDLFGRRNIEDLNFLATAKPHEKLKLLAWFHIFNLQDGDDGPYDVVMGRSAAPGVSQTLGQELDLVANWTFGPRSSILFGYSHFWAGSFYSTHPGNIPDEDADFFYTQFTLNF